MAVIGLFGTSAGIMCLICLCMVICDASCSSKKQEVVEVVEAVEAVEATKAVEAWIEVKNEAFEIDEPLLRIKED